MSDWKRDAADRRDFRHTHNGPEVPPHKSRKDTKRWCRGKVGQEHNTMLVHHSKWLSYDQCRRCGKQVAHYWRWP